MMEHNRNLSSIVGAIQDEGPPASTSKGSTTVPRDVMIAAGSVEAEAFDPTRTDRQRSTRRSFFYLLFASLVLAATFIFVSGNREGYLADFQSVAGQYLPVIFSPAENAVSNLVGNANSAGEVDSVVPALVGEGDGNSSNHEIHERQTLIMNQLEELTAAIADIRESNDRYRVDNQGELKGMQEDLQGKIDNIAATVAGLQAGPAHQEGSSKRLPEGSNDVNVAQSESDTVPASGGWVVNVANSGHIKAIEKLQKKLYRHGIRAETQELIIDGKTRYRLRIPGFSTSDEARDYAHNLDGDLGLKDPWVSKR
jgi:hypothetical protein